MMGLGFVFCRVLLLGLPCCRLGLLILSFKARRRASKFKSLGFGLSTAHILTSTGIIAVHCSFSNAACPCCQSLNLSSTPHVHIDALLFSFSMCAHMTTSLHTSYIYIYIHIYVYTDIIHVYIYIYTHTHACKCVCVYACMHRCIVYTYIEILLSKKNPEAFQREREVGR